MCHLWITSWITSNAHKLTCDKHWPFDMVPPIWGQKLTRVPSSLRFPRGIFVSWLWWLWSLTCPNAVIKHNPCLCLCLFMFNTHFAPCRFCNFICITRQTTDRRATRPVPEVTKIVMETRREGMLKGGWLSCHPRNRALGQKLTFDIVVTQFLRSLKYSTRRSYRCSKIKIKCRAGRSHENVLSVVMDPNLQWPFHQFSYHEICTFVCSLYNSNEFHGLEWIFWMFWAETTGRTSNGMSQKERSFIWPHSGTLLWKLLIKMLKKKQIKCWVLQINRQVFIYCFVFSSN